MRRGLLLLATVAGAAVVLGAGLPPSPAPAPTTTSTTTTTRPATTTTTPAGGAWSQNGSLGSCKVFPADNPWNQDVSAVPTATNSGNYLTAIATLGGNQKLHADFGG